MGETAGWSSAAAQSHLVERADGRLSYLLTLTLHTHAEEKRVRVRQMWARAGWGRTEQYLTVREILSEASRLADGALSRERSDFYRFGYATLGLRFADVSVSGLQIGRLTPFL